MRKDRGEKTTYQPFRKGLVTQSRKSGHRTSHKHARCSITFIVLVVDTMA